VGRFKAGKSSLLNKILGLDIFPTDVLPATAVITRVIPDVHDQVLVHFRGGRSQRMKVGDIPSYVTEKENPGNSKGVERVDIHLTGLGAWEGIRWVDSPGIGSLHENNTEMTLDWLPKVGVAVLAMAVDQPLAEDDIDLLRRLEEHTPETILLLTKVDRVTSEQLKSVITYVRDQLREHLKRDVPIQTVSIYPGYEGMLSALRQQLLSAGDGGIHKGSCRILRYKVLNVINECRNYLEVAVQVEKSGVEARKLLSEVIAGERRQLLSLEDEFTLWTGVANQRIRGAFQKAFLAEESALVEKLRVDLSDEASTWKGTLSEECGAYRGWMEKRMPVELDRLGREHRDAAKGPLEEVEATINREVRAFENRISEKVRAAFGVDYQGNVFELEAPVLEMPSTRIDRAFDTNLELVWFLVPMSLLRTPVHRHFISSLSWQVEKHIHRLTSEWTEKASATIRGVVEEARQHIEDELNSLQVLLERTGDSLEVQERSLDRLRGLENRIQNETGGQ
jgi:GTP-binding protein EngB required for normal cell division